MSSTMSTHSKYYDFRYFKFLFRKTNETKQKANRTSNVYLIFLHTATLRSISPIDYTYIRINNPYSSHLDYPLKYEQKKTERNVLVKQCPSLMLICRPVITLQCKPSLIPIFTTITPIEHARKRIVAFMLKIN